jgi:hypothetical protein
MHCLLDVFSTFCPRHAVTKGPERCPFPVYITRRVLPRPRLLQNVLISPKTTFMARLAQPDPESALPGPLVRNLQILAHADLLIFFWRVIEAQADSQ